MNFTSASENKFVLGKLFFELEVLEELYRFLFLIIQSAVSEDLGKLTFSYISGHNWCNSVKGQQYLSKYVKLQMPTHFDPTISFFSFVKLVYESHL